MRECVCLHRCTATHAAHIVGSVLGVCLVVSLSLSDSCSLMGVVCLPGEWRGASVMHMQSRQGRAREMDSFARPFLWE